VQTFSIHYQQLAWMCDCNHLLYNIVPKHHYLQRLADRRRLENPRRYWAYSGEDFVGRISRLGH
jgi:hypothetical protein